MAAVRELTVREIKTLLDSGEEVLLVDIREPNERDLTHIGGLFFPLMTLADHVNEIPRDKKVILYCRSGRRSYNAVAELQERFGFTNLYNMAGGLLAWSDEIDPSIPRY